MPTDIDLRAADAVVRVLDRVGVLATLRLRTTVSDTVAGTVVTTTSTHTVRAFLSQPTLAQRGAQGNLPDHDAVVIIPRTDTSGAVLPGFNENEGSIDYPGDLGGTYHIVETTALSSGEQVAGYELAVRRG
ncbi:MAG: hypothetical protein AAF196_16995 [Planctomycetota bacterium]